LPELGIHNVRIITFSEWAFELLGLTDKEYTVRFGDTEEEKDAFEYQKIKVLQNKISRPYSTDSYRALTNIYRGSFSSDSQKLFERQKLEGKFDRIDLTLLLEAHLQKHKKFETKYEYMGAVNGESKKKIRRKLIEYSLIVVDEFQNYLPEQLTLMKKCLNKETQSILYVGDMAQQVYLGTIKDWKDIEENISPTRSVRLNKVYRNTKEILEFIRSLGFSVEIPESLTSGPKVTELVLDTPHKEIDHLKSVIGKYQNGTIGVLSKTATYLEIFKKEFKDSKNVHVLTFNESQGVEFDLVCIVGVGDQMFKVEEHIDALPAHLEERKRIQKDLLYVALSRAIAELHVLGPKPLVEVLP